MTLRIHPVADLGPPPAREPAADSDEEVAEISGVARYVPPADFVRALVEEIRAKVEPQSWKQEDAVLSGQGKNVVVYNTASVQIHVARYLEELRAER